MTNQYPVLLLSLLLAACGGGGGGSQEPVPEGATVSAPVEASQPAPQPPGVAPGEDLIAELEDTSVPPESLPVESFTDPVTIPPSDIDLKVDRRALLLILFQRVTAGSADPVMAWLEYLQKRIAHPINPPMHSNGLAVFDPLWILKHRVAHCGQTNRVLVDGLQAAGYRARVVQLRNHQAAEVWLDGAWMFLDADWLKATVRKTDGSIASAEDIWRTPSLLDGLDAQEEFSKYPVQVLPVDFGSFPDMFQTKPYYYVKTATKEQERDIYFGWASYYVTVE